jgi:pheromone shutdown protein TraB
MKHENVMLIGTSHIARESIKEVHNTLEKEQPDIELDKVRFQGLMHKGKKGMRLKDIFRVGMKGFLFAMLGAWASKKLGKMVGVMPGSDMLAGIHWAKKNKKKIALIDQDISITLQKFSRRITWREKWHFVVDVVKGVVFRKPIVAFDLRTVPSAAVIKKMMKYVKIRYPNVYDVIVHERNVIMAKRLAVLHQKHPESSIVAVVGAGHEDDMMKLFKAYTKKTI